MHIGCVVNRDFEQGMFSSVVCGLKSLPPAIDAVVALPVDIPLVRSRTIRALLGRFGDAPVLYPTFMGERGHPPVFSAGCVSFITAWQGEGGLRGALEALEARLGAEELPVADANILFDLDTPEDYREALRRARRLGSPSEQEARALLDMHAVSERGRAHAEAVARVAVALAGALGEKRGWPLDMELVRSSALLHDIAKTSKNHEALGGRLLDEAGFPDAARIVESHRDNTLPERFPLTEREIVYLADKLVCCDRPVSVRKRFQEKIDRFGRDPQAFEAIAGRRGRALAMLARVERESGATAREILGKAGLYYPAEAPGDMVEATA